MFDKIARAVLAARGDEEFVCLWMYVCVCVCADAQSLPDLGEIIIRVVYTGAFNDFYIYTCVYAECNGNFYYR